ncbi:hypothetical protein F5Y14DRAFT_430448 [Nemania sp. NC0429]|nr:hypothetical protein F5Y14DRAFT_430448 [Nemania sp. NC0429]
MADADYFLDLSSSPDPLADDVPSSARPATRRITKSQHDLSSFGIPQSSPRRSLRASSPRKRTFELDVGNERSPQRIRVTVEAEEAAGRGGHDAVNRKLFPPPESPTKSTRKARSPLRREAITTTTVPLNDENEPLDGTPRNRGRPRRVSNGTPMPRGRKRAGTPMRRKSKQARLEDEPSSETGILMDASTNLAANDGEETLKPKPRARGTPRRQSANASVPSSQASGKTTGRKRGRPRKVPIPEEPVISDGAEPERNEIAISSPLASEINTQQDREGSSNPEEGGIPEQHMNDYDNPPFDPPANKSSPTSSPPQLRPSSNTARIDRSSGSPSSSHQDFPESDHYMMEEHDEGLEPQSDPRSIVSEDGMTRHGQDTIADASDFSMIAVESLPSFQASFQASMYREEDQPASDYPEMGEETSRIIGQTLDSLRRSLQTETDDPSHVVEGEKDLEKNVESRDQDQDQDQGQDETQNQSTVTTNQGSARGFSKSPRRLKQLPLSRQVFIGRGNVDDTFSSIPDSILHPATPERPPLIPATEEHGDRDGADGAYDDSFSEIPEAVLEAATPRPARRVEVSSRGSQLRTLAPALPTSQRSSPDYASNRLPTPDDTSSSNADLIKMNGEDTGVVEPQEQSGLPHHSDVPSSPPVGARPRALDYGYSNLQQELISVRETRSSSPQRQPAGNTATHKLPSLEAPLPPARPSLSPIVRAGRTLQNVMSDNSSPEGRETNLGSPFRGSIGGEHARQSSVPRSPSPSVRNRRESYKSQPPTSSPAQLSQNFGPNLHENLGNAPPNLRRAENTSSQNNITHPRRDSSHDSASHQPSGFVPAFHNSSMAGSKRLSPLRTDENPKWAPHNGNSSRVMPQRSSSQPPSSPSQRSAEKRGIGANRAATADKIDSIPTHGEEPHDDSTRTIEEDGGDNFHEQDDRESDGNGDSDHAADDADDDDDDVDIWDIEASRTSPGKREPARSVSRGSKSDVPSSRRSKVPSPWRRNNRRLIYKDDIASSSQIEIEESPQSETDQYPLPQLGQQPPTPQRQQDTARQAPDPEPVQEIQMQDQPHDRDRPSPNPSHDSYEDNAGLPSSDEPDVWMEDKELSVHEEAQVVASPMLEEPEHMIQEESEEVGMPTGPEASMDMSEYSMVARQAKPVPKPQEKPVQSKPGFFGGFDILSFFSSPATLPRNRPSGSNPPGPVNNPTAAQPIQETRQLKEPPRALWSTGLFPSKPNNDPAPSSGRRADRSSLNSGLRSSDTVADTYEPSTTASPSLSNPRSEPAAPSTPERQVFSPIQQKKDFAPQPRQSGGSLFAPSEASSSASTVELDDGLPGSSDEHDSEMTEGSEYERVPPREKPSQWDRNLSPTKSCFRSPLKPTTPGRIVAFSNGALPSIAQVQTQAQARDVLHGSISARDTILQGPRRRLTFEGEGNQPPRAVQQIRSANENVIHKNIPLASTAPRADERSRDAAPVAARVALSQTTWSKQHWQRLDEILQLRRRDPLSFHKLCSLPPREKRASAALLGKEVTARAFRVILEPWHLDVVEAFKLEVGGWDETSISKRVFALIIGEEKRRTAAAPATTATR